MKINHGNSNQNKSDKIVLEISQNPGIRFNELLRKTKIPSGTLVYYIKKLEVQRAIRVKRRSRQSRFFPNYVKEDEINTIIALRRKTMKSVILSLLENDDLSLPILSKIIKKSTSTTSVVLSELIKLELVESIVHNKKKMFKIRNKDSVIKIIKNYV